jgi:hypothetical protein
MNPGKKPILSDPTLWSLLGANLLLLIFYLTGQVDMLALVWVYWGQSVIIGLFNFFRILRLKNFSTKNFYMNGMPVEPTLANKVKVAFFFAFHYGIFHLVYAVFLSTQTLSSLQKDFSIFGALPVLAGIALFFMSHLFSFRYHEKLGGKTPNIGGIMFYPYLRIIPMHMFIVLGAFASTPAFFLFIILKAVADLGMHIFEHRVLFSE